MGNVAEDKIIKLETLKRAVRKEQPKLVLAILEDESVRLASQARSAKYVDLVEKERNHMPEWMWYLLFFLLGMLFTLSEPAIFYLFWFGLKQ